MNEQTPSQNRTRRMLLAVGGVSALAGMGVAWWRTTPAPVGAGKEPLDGFWAQQWDAPQGAPVHMQAFRGQPLLINFWATWCPPCIEELPLINAFYKKNRPNGWQVLGLAIDRPSAVQAFLSKMPLDFPVGLAGLTGSELARQLGNPAGSLPFSVVVGPRGDIVERKLGRLRPDELDAWAALK